MKAEILRAIAPLGAIYPNFDNTKLQIYASLLEDIHPVTLEEVVKLVIKTHEFTPSIATIRNKAHDISRYVNCKDEMMPAQSAWAIVRKRASSHGYERGLEGLEGVMLEAAKTVWECFNPYNKDFNESAAMSQFCKAYEQLAAREQKNMGIAEGIKHNGLLMEARKRAELNMPKQTEVKMLDNGRLIEVKKYEPIDLKRAVEKANISDEGKALILGVLK